MSVDVWIVLGVFFTGMALMWWAMSSRIELIKAERDEALAARDQAVENQKKIEEASSGQIEGAEEIVRAADLPPRDGLRLLLDTGLGAPAPSKQPPRPGQPRHDVVADSREGVDPSRA